jgi:glycerol-3-phosphate acyltransferase PlsX
MRIALDGMGGDDAPEPNVVGAIAAINADPNLKVSLVGDEERLTAMLKERLEKPTDRITVVPAADVVGMDEKPTDALRKKPNSSIAVCWQLMAAREVDAVVSAGNTGAVVASGLRTRLFLKGIKRPGIAVVLPTAKGKAVLIDVGANPAARPEHLYQYGIMGAIYASEFLGIESPRVGLMNIGSEEGKGNDLYRETHSFLVDSPLKDAYVGNVEGRGLYQGEADVLICEGFVGNVVLKVSEGMAEFLMKMAAKEILGALDTEQAKAMQVFEKLSQKLQYSETGGAPLLGIDGVCIICHGSSDDRSISNAMKMATTLKSKEINSKITAELARTVTSA